MADIAMRVHQGEPSAQKQPFVAPPGLDSRSYSIPTACAVGYYYFAPPALSNIRGDKIIHARFRARIQHCFSSRFAGMAARATSAGQFMHRGRLAM